MDNTKFFEIESSSVEQAPFAISFIYRCLFNKDDGGGTRFVKIQYPDFCFFAIEKDFRMFWELNDLKGFITDDLKPVNQQNIVPYFKEYAKGFYLGYNNYESKIKRNTSVFNDVKSNTEQIFKTINLSHGGLCAYKLTKIKNKFVPTINKQLYYDNGILLGENYKAWQIIIENPQYFIDKFLSSKKFIRAYKNSIDYFSSDKMYLGILSNLKSLIKSLPPEQTETKTDILKANLTKYGFFELLKVKALSEPNKQKLIELISNNQMPYGIAMFEYLGYCEYLDREQGTKYKADIILSRLYNPKAKDGTSSKHYRRSLINPTPRYKAAEYKETVITDYLTLK